MLFLLFAEVSSKLKGKFLQTLREKEAAESIFGHSLCFSPKMDVLFVGAEYQNFTQEGQSNPTNRMGAVYVYQYSPSTSQYELIQTIFPPSDKLFKDEAINAGKDFIVNYGWAEIRQLGSMIQVSENGKRLIAGSPYATTYKNVIAATETTVQVQVGQETLYFEPLKQVGAALVYDYNDKTGKWEYSHIFLPLPADMEPLNGLGRVGRLSPSGNTICLNYYNNKDTTPERKQGKVFTATYNPETQKWTDLTAAELPSTPENNRKDFFELHKSAINYGSEIAFVSETELFVACEVTSSLQSAEGIKPEDFPGVQVFVYNADKKIWEWDRQIQPIDPTTKSWKSYGQLIQLSGSSTSQILAVSFVDSEETNKITILSKQNGDFSRENAVSFAFGKDFDTFEFYPGSSDLFLSGAKFYQDKEQNQAEKNGALRVYEMNDNKQYEPVLDALLPPKDDRHLVCLNFGYSMVWKDKNHVFVGAHHKEPKMGPALDEPAVYFVELQKDNSQRNGIIIGCVVAAVVVIAIIVAVVVVIKKKKTSDIAAL